MTTYLLDQGDTLAAIKSGLVAGDIVDGQNNTFLVWAANAKDGDVGNPITYKNAIINGQSSTAYGIDVSGSDNIVLQNMDVTRCTTRGLYASSGSNIIGESLSFANIGNKVIDLTGITGLSLSDISIDNLSYGATLTNCSGYIQRLQTVNSPGVYVSGGSLFVNKIISLAAGAYGVKIVGATTSTWHDIDIAVSSATGNGLDFNGARNATFRKFTISGGQTGVALYGTSSNCTFFDGRVSGTSSDGYSMELTSNCEFHRCKVTGCGTDGNTSSGDGFTSLASCLANKFYFCVSNNNKNTSHAHIETSTGEIYHHTSVNDGDPANFHRAMLYLPGTGSWVVKNSLFCHEQSYRVAQCNAAPALTLSNNCYISPIAPTAGPFMIGTTASTWSAWVTATGETNSLYIHSNGGVYNVYTSEAPTIVANTLWASPVLLSGELNKNIDNPLIGAGAVISGVNTGHVFDHKGKKLSGAPDIGALGINYTLSAGGLYI